MCNDKSSFSIVDPSVQAASNRELERYRSIIDRVQMEERIKLNRLQQLETIGIPQPACASANLGRNSVVTPSPVVHVPSKGNWDDPRIQEDLSDKKLRDYANAMANDLSTSAKARITASKKRIKVIPRNGTSIFVHCGFNEVK
jgi:hypothetical protein